MQIMSRFEHLTYLSVTLDTRDTPLLAPLRGLPLKHLSFQSEFAIDRDTLTDVSAITTLTSLDIGSCPPVLNPLVNLKRLVMWDVPKCSLTALTRLEHLTISPNYDDPDLQPLLPSTTTLQDVYIRDFIPDTRSVSALFDYPLTRLVFEYTAPGQIKLPATLQHLEFCGFEEPFPPISHLTALTSLEVRKFNDIIPDLTRFTNLKHLAITSDDPLTPDHTIVLQQLVHLTSLHVALTPLLTELASLTALQRLHLTSHNPSRLSALRDLSALTDLCVRILPEFDDDVEEEEEWPTIDVPSIASLTKLRRLSLVYPAEQGGLDYLSALSALPSLTHLRFRRCFELSEDSDPASFDFLSALTQLSSLRMEQTTPELFISKLPPNIHTLLLEQHPSPDVWAEQAMLGRCVMVTNT